MCEWDLCRSFVTCHLSQPLKLLEVRRMGHSAVTMQQKQMHLLSLCWIVQHKGKVAMVDIECRYTINRSHNRLCSVGEFAAIRS
jgi:hypothetical protein